ncbi:MAG: Holliday junction resolvase RuvX [Acidimicrobiales bacterium]
MRALALDMGSKRIGVAISDSGGRVATPIDTVHRCGDRPREHREIAALVLEWEAEIVVVGLPLSLDGTIGPAAKGVLDEIDVLGAALSVPVETYDERLTTVTADRSLMEQNLGAAERRKVVDKVAAAVMLQAWLDRRSMQPDPARPKED